MILASDPKSKEQMYIYVILVFNVQFCELNKNSAFGKTKKFPRNEPKHFEVFLDSFLCTFLKQFSVQLL